MTDATDDHTAWEATVLAGQNHDPHWAAALAILDESGAKDLRVCLAPIENRLTRGVLWYATAFWQEDVDGPVDRDEIVGGSGPLEAVLRLCKLALEGEPCTECGRPTVFVAHDSDYRMNWEIPKKWKPVAPGKQLIASYLWTELACVYEWDIKRAQFLRSCSRG